MKENQNTTVSFIVDGKVAYVHTVEIDAASEEIKVPLNYGLDLKIVVEGGRTIGLGNVIFWAE